MESSRWVCGESTLGLLLHVFLSLGEKGEIWPRLSHGQMNPQLVRKDGWVCGRERGRITLLVTTDLLTQHSHRLMWSRELFQQNYFFTQGQRNLLNRWIEATSVVGNKMSEAEHSSKRASAQCKTVRMEDISAMALYSYMIFHVGKILLDRRNHFKEITSKRYEWSLLSGVNLYRFTPLGNVALAFFNLDNAKPRSPHFMKPCPWVHIYNLLHTTAFLWDVLVCHNL